MIGRFERNGSIRKKIDLDDVTLAVLIIRGIEFHLHYNAKGELSPEQIAGTKEKIYEFMEKFMEIRKQDI